MSHQLALITGASSGIGDAFAHKLAERGFDLCIIGRRNDRLESVAAELREKHKVHVEVIGADLATEEGIQKVETWIKANPTITLLINNAGFGIRGQFANRPIEMYSEMITVHVHAVARFTSAVLPAMINAKQGAIINVSSITAYIPLAGNAVYSGTKSFLKSFSRALSLELKNKGVKVQLLVPGFTYSDFHKRPEYSKQNAYTTIPKFLWMTSEQVAEISLNTLERNKFECVPGWINKMIIFAGKIGFAALASNIMAHRYKKSD